MRLGREEFKGIVGNQIGWGWIIETYNTSTSNMVYSASQKGMDCYYTILQQLGVKSLFKGPELKDNPKMLHLEHIQKIGMIETVDDKKVLTKNGAEWVFVFLTILNHKTWGHKNRLYKRAFLKMIETVTLSSLRIGYSVGDYFDAKTRKVER
jgi:hypothetical protein